jgi:hypothetical protein
MKLIDLPTELLLEIVSLLTVFNSVRLRASCKRLYQGLDPVPTLRWPAYEASTLFRYEKFRAVPSRMRLHSDDISEPSLRFLFKFVHDDEFSRCMRYGRVKFTDEQLQSLVFNTIDGHNGAFRTAAQMAEFLMFEACAEMKFDFTEVSRTWNPLEWALLEHHCQLANRLIQDPRVDLSKKASRYLKASARSIMCLESFKLLVCKLGPTVADEDGMQPLHTAAEYGCLEHVKFLLSECGVDPRATDNTGRQAIHLVVGDSLNLYGKHVDSLGLLLQDARVDPRAADNRGRQAIHYAVSARADDIDAQVETVRLLLKHARIDPNAADADGKTPLSLAAGPCHELLAGDARVQRHERALARAWN